jgi:hypothetical protein
VPGWLAEQWLELKARSVIALERSSKRHFVIGSVEKSALIDHPAARLGWFFFAIIFQK